ncbi:hypothetical protein [Pedosphaera parvula]|uniref:Uncharacterized protein n=1 Tax=Pedosphaera parvula (strain Ellin514) TaxID=320771 RepID=B9XH77_PEDPL|nr:hypothetical protein [Pedosphaera parvula]EEF60712.1 hypothetical protein Cflav_PD3570 [Pedosphaera parvula Ellin514]
MAAASRLADFKLIYSGSVGALKRTVSLMLPWPFWGKLTAVWSPGLRVEAVSSGGKTWSQDRSVRSWEEARRELDYQIFKLSDFQVWERGNEGEMLAGLAPPEAAKCFWIGDDYLGLAVRFTPGFHMADFQPLRSLVMRITKGGTRLT